MSDAVDTFHTTMAVIPQLQSYLVDRDLLPRLVALLLISILKISTTTRSLVRRRPHSYRTQGCLFHPS